MNDYERACQQIAEAVNTVESIDTVDPDIEEKVVAAIEALNEAQAMAAQRA